MENLTDVELTVKSYILDEFLAGTDPQELTRSTPLVSAGILDSLATLKLVAFLEQRFSIALGASDTDSDNLETIARIAKLVEAKS
jgi:acyl carrier protein